MIHQVRDAASRSLLDENAALHVLATDFIFTEGPML